MYIARDMFCFAVPLTISTGVGGCWWPISARVVLMYVFFWKFSNNPPNYISVDDAITFLIMLNYTCTDPFSGGISCIGVLDFGPTKNILRICFVPLVLICRMHLNICGG